MAMSLAMTQINLPLHASSLLIIHIVPFLPWPADAPFLPQ